MLILYHRGESSRRLEQRPFRLLQHPRRDLATNRRKAFEKFLERIVIFQIIEERRDRHASAVENGSSTQNLGVVMINERVAMVDYRRCWFLNIGLPPKMFHRLPASPWDRLRGGERTI